MAEPLNIKLVGPAWEPQSPTWATAPEPLRARYWHRLGEIAVYHKRIEIAEGRGVDGKRFTAVKKRSRPDGATGAPFNPHYAQSRTYRLLDYKVHGQGVTLFWRGHGRKSWAKILGYHAYKHGPRALPVRNTIGISERGQRRIRVQSQTFWDTISPKPKPERKSKAKGAPAPRPAPRTYPKYPRDYHDLPFDFTASQRAKNAKKVTVVIDVEKLDRNWAKDHGYYVPPGEEKKPGARARVEEFLARAARDKIPVEMSEITLDEDGNISFVDGRHRFGVLRDKGLRNLPVSVSPEEAEAIRKRFGWKPPGAAKPKPPSEPRPRLHLPDEDERWKLPEEPSKPERKRKRSFFGSLIGGIWDAIKGLFGGK